MYLYPADYKTVIQEVSLQQIISGDSTLIARAELYAQEVMRSHLRQKYDVGKEFSNTQLYNPARTYNAGDRVYLDGAAYSTAATYTEGQLCLQGGKVYQCTVAIITPELFNPAHWTLLGAQYDLFYANYPHPVFNIQGQYKVGDQVWYKNHIYTALKGSRYYDHETLIQFGNTNAIPYQNYFPDDPNNGSKSWQDNGLYAVPAGNLLTTKPNQTVTLFQAREDLPLVAGVTVGMMIGGNSYQGPVAGEEGSLVGWSYSLERKGLGTMTEGVDYEKSEDGRGFALVIDGDDFGSNEIFVVHFVPITNQPVPVATTGLSAYQVIMTYFSKGDNRNQELVQHMMDIMIYRMYARVSKPMPEERKDNYKLSMMWLKDCAKGDAITADIPKIQPPQGNRIRWGSNIKQTNSY